MKSNGISVIISHYEPSKDITICRRFLSRTIESVRNQHVNFEVEIIICDDGSFWSQNICGENRDLIDMKKEQIINNRLLCDLDVDRYIYLYNNNAYRRVKIQHIAFLTSKFNKIVALDDDHPLYFKKSLSRFYHYLDKYEFVRGRIIKSNGMPQTFFTRNVQGTTYGLTKSLYKKMGGFGEYLFDNSCGDDDDLNWKVYNILFNNYPDKRRACYAGEIITRDQLTSRWVYGKTQQGSNSFVDLPIQKDLRNKTFTDIFIMKYHISPNDNPSRIKQMWMVIPSYISLLSEFCSIIIYYIYMAPLYIKKKIDLFIRFISLSTNKQGRYKIKKRIFF